MKQGTLEKIQNLAVSLQLVTVDDMCKHSLPQLVTMIANKLNEVIHNLNCFEVSVEEQILELNQLLNVGMSGEVEEKLNEWLENGTLENLINQNIFTELIEKVNMVSNKVEKNPIFVVKKLTADGIIETINECVNSGGGLVYVPQTNTDFYIDKYINIPVGVTLDFNFNSVVVSENAILKNNFILGMNSRDGVNWDSPYNPKGCELRNLKINAWHHQNNDISGVRCLTKSGKIKNCEFNEFRKAIVKDKYYTDLFTIDHVDVSISSQRYNGKDALISIESMGDGLFLNQIHISVGTNFITDSYNRYGLYIFGCSGGIVQNLINGDVNLFNCKSLTFDGCHFERGHIKTEYCTNVTFKNCGFVHVNDGQPPITIDSSTAVSNGRSSHITVDNVHFGFTNDQSYRPTNPLYDIALNGRGVLDIRNCYRTCGNLKMGLSLSYNGENFKTFNKLSSQASLHSIIQNGKLMSTIHIKGDKSSTYKPNGTSLGEMLWNTETGLYYYYCQLIIDGDRLLSRQSSEYSCPTSGEVIKHTLSNSGLSGCVARFYRGKSSNLYTHVVEIPILSDWNSFLIDFGRDMSGHSWEKLESPVNSSNITSSVNWCNQCEYTPNHFNAFMAEKPTGGVWNKGDKVFNNFDGDNHCVGWVYNGSEFIEF